MKNHNVQANFQKMEKSDLCLNLKLQNWLSFFHGRYIAVASDFTVLCILDNDDGATTAAAAEAVFHWLLNSHVNPRQ